MGGNIVTPGGLIQGSLLQLVTIGHRWLSCFRVTLAFTDYKRVTADLHRRTDY